MANLHPSAAELFAGDLPLVSLEALPPASFASQTIEATYPLSPMQAGMLFNSLYVQQSGVGIEQLVCTLRESLNLIYLEQAWQRVAQRHSVLRTSIHWEGLEHPEQHVHPSQNLRLVQRDWRDLAPFAQQDRLQAYLQRDRLQGFSLDQAPLMRLVVFQVADDGYHLVWTFHHILLDGRSIVLLLKEVFAIYTALCQGLDLPLDLPHPYQAYINWLQRQDASAAQAYWTEQLAGFTLPTPLPETANAEVGQGEAAIQLSEAATAAFKALAKQCSVTPNTILQGAWALLLSHYSGSDDIVFGATRACRHSIAEAESMVGLLINTLPVRVHTMSEMPLAEWLQSLRNQHLSIRPYEYTPLSQVQQWSDVPAGVSLFDSLVVFENNSLNEALQSQAGWENRQVRLFEQPSYALTLTGNLGAELLLRIYYDRQRFSEPTVQRMLTQLSGLIEKMVAQPDRPLADFSLLTAAERHQILVEWNATAIDYPKHLRLHDLFEQQVSLTPDAVAAVSGNQFLTYRQLNQRANQVAHYLQKLGIQPEIPVGICIERSLEMIVGLMAIAKAGGAYVPLNPAYPQNRLALIISDSQLAVVLTQQKFQLLLSSSGVPVVCLDRDWQTIACESAENPTSSATAESLAYIIYTSGSTGKPKGVLIEHRGAVNTLLDINRRFAVGEGDRGLAVCSLNFDLSVYDVFGLLGAGGTVVIPQPAIAPDLDHWIDLMERHQITVWNSAPPVMQMLAGHLVDRDRRLPGSLRLVMLSGDWIPVTLPDLIRQLKPDSWVDIISLGGATEVSIWSIFHAIKAINPAWKSIPYGKPLSNQQIYVLNKRLHPVAVGEVGELYIGGDGVARGYLNRPELNETKFIADPFNDQPHAQLYRTGDLGRYLSDGTIEFLGRIDHQVKIRGFRVELGEIESVLSQHPAVRESTILAQDDGVGNSSLVAYLVAERSYTGSLGEEVRRFLKEKLPDYMVPSAFVMLASLPLTPNGKLDRKMLPAVDLHSTLNAAHDSFVAPRTEIERRLVQLWQVCLAVQPIGVTDNFFELGGHSLLAVRLWSKVEEAFHQKLPLTMLFQAPTIAQLAERLRWMSESPDLASSASVCPSLVVIQEGQGEQPKTPLFCIHVLGRGLKFYRPLAQYLDPRQRVYGVSTHIAAEAFPSNRVTDLATHYVKQIRALQPEGPYLLTGVSFGGLVAFEVAQQLIAQGQRIALLGLLDTRLANALKPLPKSERMAEHWSRFVEKGLGYAFDKLQEGAMGRFCELQRKWRNLSYEMSIQLSEAVGQPLHEDWQDYLYEQQNLKSTEGYEPKAYPGKITLFKATEQLVGVSSMLEPELGWRNLAVGGLELYTVPGSHLGMLQNPSAQVLGVVLRKSIARAMGEPTHPTPPDSIQSSSSPQQEILLRNDLQTTHGFA